MHAKIDDQPLPPAAIVHEVGLFISGGAETTRTAISHGLRAFVDHPDQWEAMAADPTLVPAAVEEILTSAGLSVDDLDNTPALPYDEAVARQVLRSGGSPTRLAQNCSGKHAAMVATCVVKGWPVAGYLANDHPLQKAITADIVSMTGEAVDRIGIDGCGAPAHAFSLFGLARAYGRARSSTDPAHGIANAMIAHPEIVGGTRLDVTLMMQNLPTILIKDGADGVMAAALADGTGIALKIGDGAAPPRVAVLLHVLTLLGIDVAAAAAAAPLPVFGHGQPVGHVRCVL